MEFKIQNMVGSCDVKFPIRLEGLVINQPQFSRLACYIHVQYSPTHCVPHSSYEPELFPGLIYRMVKPRIVLLIFVSGKVVLTGKYLYSCSYSNNSQLILCRGEGEVRDNGSLHKHLSHPQKLQEDIMCVHTCILWTCFNQNLLTYTLIRKFLLEPTVLSIIAHHPQYIICSIGFFTNICFHRLCVGVHCVDAWVLMSA